MNSTQIIHVVDHDAESRRWLEKTLTSAGLHVKLYACTTDFLASGQLNQPGCLLVECKLPDLSGIELLRILADRHAPLVPILMTFNTRVSTAVEAIKLGASDYLEKPIHPEVLLNAAHGALATSSRQWLVKSAKRNIDEQVDELSSREKQVMNLLTIGKHTKVIATELGLSPKTVEHHRPRILSKMGVENVVELTRLIMMTQTA